MYTRTVNDGYYTHKMTYDRRLSRMPYASAGIKLDGEGNNSLVSYSTLIASVNDNTPSVLRMCYANFTYSATTRKHFGAFLREYNPHFTYHLCKKALAQLRTVVVEVPADWEIRDEIGSVGVYYYDTESAKWYYAGSVSYTQR